MASRGGSSRGRRVTAASDPQQQRRDSGPQTDKGQQRRDQLVEAAHTVFERKGFVDARVADIVAEANVAQGTFYSYFDSKDAIFREVCEIVVDRMMQDVAASTVVSDDAPMIERIRAGLRGYIEVYRENARMIALTEQVGTFTPEMREMRLHVREAWLARLERAIKKQQAEGIADPTLDPYMTVQVLGAMADHTCYVWFSLGKPYDDEDVLDTLTTVWARTIGVENSQEWKTPEI
ncbi:TetR/AcrR family transcriptional regulator [Pseudonocardia pini]|uniref:TetR/AcrR family transcriptional regulator n=1 Tax=Pseudonocardia pini TaxID=2758030 RepID=UPI0015F0EC77|nr:TetR/AcrR family transcriptional regulator [Pseudonocardia pini]